MNSKKCNPFIRSPWNAYFNNSFFFFLRTEILENAVRIVYKANTIHVIIYLEYAACNVIVCITWQENMRIFFPTVVEQWTGNCSKGWDVAKMREKTFFSICIRFIIIIFSITRWVKSFVWNVYALPLIRVFNDITIESV